MMGATTEELAAFHRLTTLAGDDELAHDVILASLRTAMSELTSDIIRRANLEAAALSFD